MGATPSPFATAQAESPSGFMKSSRRVSPGCGIGSRSFFVFMVFSVVVGNLHLRRAFLGPAEADTPLLVDSYRMQPRPPASQGFQTVPRRNPQIIQASRLVELRQFAKRNRLHLPRQSLRSLACKDLECFFTGERLNHSGNIAALYVASRNIFRERYRFLLFDICAARLGITTSLMLKKSDNSCAIRSSRRSSNVRQVADRHPRGHGLRQ